MSIADVRKRAAPAPTVESLRARIDRLNREIVRIVSARAELARAIGRLKPPAPGAIYQPARERQVLDQVAALNRGPLSAEQMQRVFVEIISACRALEHPLRVAFLGPEHTYSHEAARQHFGASVEFEPEPSIAAVFNALESGRADFSVVPVENSTDGSVTLTLDLLIDTPLVIIGEILIPIRHALMSRAGERAAIRRIVAHQQSLGQCRGYLAANFPGCDLEAMVSNAAAARRAAEEPELAAIASRAAGEAYGLKLIAENIQDQPHNTTRFLVMGKQPAAPSGADKTSVLFAVRDKVGALHEVLSLFSRARINITKIESRPMRSRPWEYLFFVDLSGHREQPRVRRALKALAAVALFSKVLGSYPEGRPGGA